MTHGPCAWLRNPLNLAELTLFIGLAAWYASWEMAAYAVAAFLAFHLFIVAHEEPRHRHLFGAGYAAYAARVPRWFS